MFVKKRSSAGILGTLSLTGVVISSMIGGGIYSLPQNMAASASAGAVILAWGLSGIGIFLLQIPLKRFLLYAPI